MDRYAVARTSGSQGLKALIVQDRSMMELLFAVQVGNFPGFSTSPITILQRLLTRTRWATVTIGRGFYPSAVGLAYAPKSTDWFVDRLWLAKIDPIEEVVDQLNRFQPNILLAYSSVLEILAREVLAGRLQLSRKGRLQQVINMSEPLSEAAQRLLATAFHLPVTNNYATGECMCLSLGCPEGHGMHLQADWVILEVVDLDNRPVEAGRPGEKVLLTNLYNTIQPFIRYEVGDVVTISPEPCPCGSPLPLILKVEGRTDEVTWIWDGDRFREVHPYVFVDCLDELPKVGWYQVSQVERNRYELRVSPAPGQQIEAGDLGRKLHGDLRQFGLADLIRVDVLVVPDMAPDPRTGKLKRITSRIGPPQADRSAPRHLTSVT
jgi:phenylacetate-coenzyme A ligase PaaK-like adenylate-forming protein